MELQKKLIIQNKLGLHTRAATKLVKTALQFSCEITISAKGKTANAKSIMGIMLLAASKGTVITLFCAGTDAKEALETLERLINNKFDEE